MTVFGFGRDVLEHSLELVPATFLVSLATRPIPPGSSSSSGPSSPTFVPGIAAVVAGHRPVEVDVHVSIRWRALANRAPERISYGAGRRADRERE